MYNEYRKYDRSEYRPFRTYRPRSYMDAEAVDEYNKRTPAHPAVSIDDLFKLITEIKQLLTKDTNQS